MTATSRPWTKGPWDVHFGEDYTEVYGRADDLLLQDLGPTLLDANAALVALAPEMAEALLEYEWVDDGHPDRYPECPVCSTPQSRADAKHPFPHSDWCKWGALCDKLRAIGETS